MSSIRSKIVGAFALTVLLSVSSFARAQTFSAAPGQRFEMDLDTVDGHVSSWNYKDIAAASAMKAIISISRMGSDPKWIPYFTVRLAIKSPQMQSAGLRIQKDRGGLVSMDAYYRNSDNKDVVVKHFDKVPGLKQNVALEMSWGSRGLSIRVDGETAKIELPAEPTMISVSSSTGEMKAAVELGNVR